MAEMLPKAAPPPAIIVISSHVVRGTVGNRAAAFALEVLGHAVWALPSITLPWHPGHTPVAGPGTRLVPPQAAFDAMIDDLASAPWLGEVGAVLSGYLGAAAQAQSVARLVQAVKARNSGAIYAFDPVLGDDSGGGGRLYVPEKQAQAMRQHLLPLADLITPNAFELGVLAGCDMPRTAEDFGLAAQAAGVPVTVVTSAPGRDGFEIGNWLFTRGHHARVTTRRLKHAPNGAGDLTAALMVSGLLRGLEPHEALRRTTASVLHVLEASATLGTDELPLERCLDALLEPNHPVNLDRDC